MYCMFCGKGPKQGVTLYRLNRTGETGIWACSKHIKNTDVRVDPNVKAICDAINPKG